jgi:hypothetical protein
MSVCAGSWHALRMPCRNMRWKLAGYMYGYIPATFTTTIMSVGNSVGHRRETSMRS